MAEKQRTNISRRLFSRGLACATTFLSFASKSLSAESIPQATRPQPPYRIWFQPRLFDRDIDLYRSMTIDASGWLDPRLAERFGITSLDWVYGLNHPDAKGSDYWREVCSKQWRSRPKDSPQFVSAGIAIDEWVPPAVAQNLEWLCNGLREGKKANPDVFVAIWTTDPTPELLQLGQDNTVDLIIVEGYTHSVRPDHSTSWEGGLRRMDALAHSGLSNRTVFCFGHITDRKNHRGEHLAGSWLREKAEELKDRYPQSPGIAFFQTEDPETSELRELIKFCDRLSAELWPSPTS